jgi:group I intron endonuclease
MSFSLQKERQLQKLEDLRRFMDGISNTVPVKGTTGIYVILCRTTDMVYIGKSLDVRARLFSHRNSLQNGTHKNSKMQLAFNRYGESSFTCCLLEECTEKELNNKEAYYISYFNSLKFGFNQRKEYKKGTN